MTENPVTAESASLAIPPLSLEEIGASFAMLVPACLTAGHSSVQGTLDYIHGAPGSPAAFVKDVLTLPPAEVARKWYGGERRAKLMCATAVTDAILGDAGSDAR